MKPKKLDWIINLIREEMVANAPGSSGGFSGSADPKGPVAGYDKPIRNKKRYIYNTKRKPWLDHLKGK